MRILRFVFYFKTGMAMIWFPIGKAFLWLSHTSWHTTSMNSQDWMESQRGQVIRTSTFQVPCALHGGGVFFFFFATSCGLWDLSALARDWTQAPWKCWVPTTRPPGNSQCSTWLLTSMYPQILQLNLITQEWLLVYGNLYNINYF